MNRFRDWLAARREDRQPLPPVRRFTGTDVMGRAVERVLWDGPSAAILLAGGALVKVWLDGARHPQDRVWLEQFLDAQEDAALPVTERALVGEDMWVMQTGVRSVLPLDPTLARFRPDDTDNRLELVTDILKLLVAAGVAGPFSPVQLCQDSHGQLRFDALGAPYPPPHLHRLLTRRHHLDELHLRPWPAPAEVLSPGFSGTAAAIWCAGHLLFELLTGQAPFGSTDATLSGMALLLEGPPSARALNSQVPAELSRLLARMLAADPRQRPASLQLCLDVLLGAL